MGRLEKQAEMSRGKKLVSNSIVQRVIQPRWMKGKTCGKVGHSLNGEGVEGGVFQKR